MLDPKPDLYTLINVCAGAYNSEPEFAQKILDAFCSCVVARGGNTDRLRALNECGRLPTPHEVAAHIQQEPAKIMEFARAATEAWNRVLAGIEDTRSLSGFALAIVWGRRTYLLRTKEDDIGGGLAGPDPSRCSPVLQESYRAAIRAERRTKAMATTQLAILDARIFEMLTGLPVTITEADDGQPVIVDPVSEADLLAAGFPNADEVRAWWDRNGP